MAVKVRCSDCKKQIAVDEAFAGSMCRCPYCKSIIMVPAKHELEINQTRSSRPQKRPDKPGGHRTKKKRGLFATRKGKEQNVVGASPIIDKSDIPIPRFAPGRSSVDQHSRSRPTRDEKPSAGGALSGGNKPAGLPIVGGSGLKGTIRPAEEKAATSSDQAEALTSLAGSGLAAEAEGAAGAEILEAAHVDASNFSDDQLAAIPTANPVRMQGILSLILIAVAIVIVGLCIYFGISMLTQKNKTAVIYKNDAQAVTPTPKANANPFIVGSISTVCGDTKIIPPVVYCVDADARLAAGGLFTFARDVIRASVLSIPADESFGVVVAQDSGPKFLKGKMLPGGKVGNDEINNSLNGTTDGGEVEIGGRSDLTKALSLALEQKPKTLVLIISRRKIDDPDETGKMIARTGTKLVLVVLGYENSFQAASYRAFAKSAGGAVEVIYSSVSRLAEMYDKKNTPE